MCTRTVLRSERFDREGPRPATDAGGALAVWGRAAPDGGEDPRVAELRRAVARMRRQLAGHPADLSDRAVADDALDSLDSMARNGVPQVAGLRHALLLIAGAVGSVSALAGSLAEVRAAIEQFAEPPSGR